MAEDSLRQLTVSVRTGDLEVVTSGVVNFQPDKGLKIVVGPITIEFIFHNTEPGQIEIQRNPFPDTLTFQYVIKGPVPSGPASVGLKYPEAIGISLGIPIHLSFGLSVLGNDQKALTLQYTVYRGQPTPEQPSKGLEGHDA